MLYQWTTNSNAAPFVSDHDSGFIDAATPMDALKEVVAEYKHPAGLYAAIVKEVSTENKVLAHYWSARAHTAQAAPNGITEWKEDGLYVNDVRQADLKEEWG